MPELSEKISELLAYDGIEVAEVHQGKEVQYQPPKDAYFIVVPKDAVPHQETAKERMDGLKLRFAEKMLQQGQMPRT